MQAAKQGRNLLQLTTLYGLLVSVLPEFVLQLFNVQNKVFKKALPLLTGTNSDERSRPTNFSDQQEKPTTLRVTLSANTALAFQGP